MMKDALGYYSILNADALTSAEQLKLNYRELAKKWHPDYNNSPQAMEIFQKLSTAYEVLQDEKKRLIYDMLSMVYPASEYPDIALIEPFTSQSQEGNIRVLTITDVRGLFYKTRVKTEKYICNYQEAFQLEGKKAVANWLLGWWSPTAWIKNCRALKQNFTQVNKKTDNLRLLTHNAVAYWQKQNIPLAVQSAALALAYADAEQKGLLQKFITLANARPVSTQKWNFSALKGVQLIVPLCLLMALGLAKVSAAIDKNILLKYFSSPKEIIYYQEVDFGSRGQTVDDVVVSKILSIPVDKGDDSKLYHLNQKTKIMYGPSEDFDVLKEAPAGTTVRLTGKSPDEIWSRIMIDNGEMGFVKADELTQGIGNPIPDYSEIILHH